MDFSFSNFQFKFQQHFYWIATFLLFLISSTWSSGQTKASEDNELNVFGIYVEGYAYRHDFNEGYASLNFERFVGARKGVSLRIGVYPDFETLWTFPISITKITAPLKKHHLEYGIGFIYRIEFFQDQIYRDVPAIIFPVMYRYGGNYGIYIRAGVNAMVSYPSLLSPSASVGFRF